LNKRQKRAKIIASALRLFSKQGFYKTTMRDIADALEISEGTLYNHFPSKMSLATAAISHVTGKMAIDLRYINNKSIPATEKICEFVRSYFCFIQKHPEMVEYFFQVYLSNREIFCDEDDCGFSLAKEFIEELERLINDGVQTHDFTQENFFIAFSSIMGILGSITFLYNEGVLQKPLDAHCDEIAQAICRALQS
jgi:AcrR family transcriptional regulator